MAAFMETLGISIKGKIAWLAKELPLVLLILALIGADSYIIGQEVSARWLPVLGLVLGIGLAYFGFKAITFLRSVTRHCPACGKGIITDSKEEKIVLILGMLLLLIGLVLVCINNSIALIFGVHWLHSWGPFLGLIVVCIGWWMLTLFSGMFKSEGKPRLVGFILSGVLLIEVLLKFGFSL